MTHTFCQVLDAASSDAVRSSRSSQTRRMDDSYGQLARTRESTDMLSHRFEITRHKSDYENQIMITQTRQQIDPRGEDKLQAMQQSVQSTTMSNYIRRSRSLFIACRRR